MAKKLRELRPDPVLRCVVCEGGRPDRNGAHTVCALCHLDERDLEVPAAA